MKRAEEPSPRSGREEAELVARLAKNVLYLIEVNGWTKTDLKGYAWPRGVSPRTIDNVITGKGNPEARTIAIIARVLGVDAGRITLPHDELVAHVEEEGLNPLPSPRPATISLRSSEASGAGSPKLGDKRSLVTSAA